MIFFRLFLWFGRTHREENSECSPFYHDDDNDDGDNDDDDDDDEDDDDDQHDDGCDEISSYFYNDFLDVVHDGDENDHYCSYHDHLIQFSAGGWTCLARW